MSKNNNIQAKAEKVVFLEDDKGTPSSMRLMSMIALIASVIFGIISLVHPGAVNNVNSVWITTAFLIAAFCPKALQKFAEVKF